MMTAGKPELGDKTESERRKQSSDRQIKDLELAGGIEGGMRAGSAGGPGEKDQFAGSPPAADRQD
jgi:hypothetical protein